MADVTRLKKKAAELEAKRQYDRAVVVYEQVLAESGTDPQESDIPLYNRVGDIHLRLGDVDRAVTMYERAVDLYSELGFFNNAIALCNKILRQAPNRASIYYKLGRISAKKGFNSDAKQNFLEYAARMQRAGKMDEAFRSLKEFADLCPGQDDVRLMLAEQLGRAGRKTEALEQLQVLHEQLESQQRTDEATAAAARIKALDPKAQPRHASGRVTKRASDLVFLDLDGAVAPSAVAPLDGLEPTSLAESSPPPLPARPLTPQEFSVVELPPPVDEAVAKPSAIEEELDLPPLPPLSPAAEEPTVAGIADAPTMSAAHDEMTEPPVAARAREAPFEPPAPFRPDEDFVDLGDWLREDETPRTTRMVTDAEEPPEGEQADFQEMLAKFKEGLAANMDEEDYASHYDLGVAFKEMGLTDEAIAEFQKALRGPAHRVAAYEALGQCFVDKRQFEVAIALMQKALREPGFEDEHFLGVLYLLGFANEALGRNTEAAPYYHRVLAVDIRFRDVGERLTAVTEAAR